MKKFLVLLLGASCSAMEMELLCLCKQITFQRPEVIDVELWRNNIGSLLLKNSGQFGFGVSLAVEKVYEKEIEVVQISKLFLKNAFECEFPINQYVYQVEDDCIVVTEARLINFGLEEWARKLVAKISENKLLTRGKQEKSDPKTRNIYLLLEMLCAKS